MGSGRDDQAFRRSRPEPAEISGLSRPARPPRPVSLVHWRKGDRARGTGLNLRFQGASPNRTRGPSRGDSKIQGEMGSNGRSSAGNRPTEYLQRLEEIGLAENLQGDHAVLGVVGGGGLENGTEVGRVQAGEVFVVDAVENAV